jgi:hypothetical protein
MKPHPATKHLISKEYTLGKGANWLHGLSQLDRWNSMTGISDLINIPLMWPYAWTILTNGAEAAAHPKNPPPVYLVWIEETWDISEIERASRVECLMFYWWLCDRADIRFLAYSLREKPRRRNPRNTSPIVSPWWDKIDLMDEWLKIK